MGRAERSPAAAGPPGAEHEGALLALQSLRSPPAQREPGWESLIPNPRAELIRESLEFKSSLGDMSLNSGSDALPSVMAAREHGINILAQKSGHTRSGCGTQP